MKKLISIVLVLVMAFACAVPAFAVQSEQSVITAAQESGGNAFVVFFADLFGKIGVEKNYISWQGSQVIYLD